MIDAGGMGGPSRGIEQAEGIEGRRGNRRDREAEGGEGLERRGEASHREPGRSRKYCDTYRHFSDKLRLAAGDDLGGKTAAKAGAWEGLRREGGA